MDQASAATGGSMRGKNKKNDTRKKKTILNILSFSFEGRQEGEGGIRAALRY